MDNALIDDFKKNEEQVFKLASKGTRFGNYIIDYIAVTIIAIFVFVPIVIIFPDFISIESLDQGDTLQSKLKEYAVTALVFVLYYSICETLFSGKTLGKLITKTRAVNFDNSKMNFGTAIKRSFCRMIPFEQFSFLGSLGSGWHDTLSDTKVIEDIGWK